MAKKFNDLSPLRKINRLIVKAFKEDKLPWTQFAYRELVTDANGVARMCYCAVGGANEAFAPGTFQNGAWSLALRVASPGAIDAAHEHAAAIISINDAAKTKGEMLRKVRAYVDAHDQQ